MYGKISNSNIKVFLHWVEETGRVHKSEGSPWPLVVVFLLLLPLLQLYLVGYAGRVIGLVVGHLFQLGEGQSIDREVEVEEGA